MTRPVPATLSGFFGRPFRVLFADRFVEVTRQAIADPSLRQVSADIGAVDQFGDCVDLTDRPALNRKLAILFQGDDKAAEAGD